MVVVCPQCGKEIFYITAPGVAGEIYMVDTKVQRLISRTGRVLEGYSEHICTPKPEYRNS